MYHIMQLDQHHNGEEQWSQDTEMARTSTSVSVSQVAFALAAIAFLSLFSSFAVAVRPSSLPSALSAELLASLCSFVTTKKALFFLSNIIFLFLAADCRCFFGICSLSPSTSDDLTASELPPSGVLAKQARHHQEEMVTCVVPPCISYSESLYHSNSNTASENCSEDHGEREEMAVPSQPELSGLEEEEANSVNLETFVVEEPTCGTAAQELEQLEIDELNRKFDEFITGRRIKWQQEETLQCQQV